MVETLIRQHEEIRALLAQIEGMLPEKVAESTFEVLMKVSELAGKLKMHLAQEDRVLYPSLLRHQDARVRDTADRFTREMGGLAETFTGFRTKYAGVNAIKGDPEQFQREMRRLASALRRRIEAEEKELYPLAQR